MYSVWMYYKSENNIDTLIYVPTMVHAGYSIISGIVSMEINKSGSFEFVISPEHPNYNAIQKLWTRIYVYDDDDLIFCGRVLTEKIDFRNQKKVYCEGELSYLNDTIVRPYDFRGSVADYFTQLITNHNYRVDSADRFEIGNVTVTDPNDYIVRSSSDYPKTMDEIKKKLLDSSLGGFIQVREGANHERYIDYLTSVGVQSDQVIRFGYNLLDLSKFISAEDIFTIIIPIGKDGLTIKSVNYDVDNLVNSVGTSTFGRIERVVKWDDVTIASNLKAKGQAYLDESVQLATTLNLKAVDMHILNVDIERIKVGDSVRVISPPHNLDTYFLCSKVKLDLQNPDKSEYIFGKAYKNMTDRMG